MCHKLRMMGSFDATQVASYPDIIWQDGNWKGEIPWDGEPSHDDTPGWVDRSALLFDYSLLHRGQAHTREELRSLLYCTTRTAGGGSRTLWTFRRCRCPITTFVGSALLTSR